MLLSQLFLFSGYTEIANGRTQRYLTSHYVTITCHSALFKEEITQHILLPVHVALEFNASVSSEGSESVQKPFGCTT